MQRPRGQESAMAPGMARGLALLQSKVKGGSGWKLEKGGESQTMRGQGGVGGVGREV